MPSKSRSPFWNRFCSQKLTGEVCLTLCESIVTVLVPCGRQMPSANSQSCPLAKLLLGHAIGPLVPSVVAPLQTPVFGSQPPSPVLCRCREPPSEPPTHVWKVLLSTIRPGWLIGNLCASERQTSECPISCCISTPPSSAAHGTMFFLAAVAYSAWKVCLVPAQVR